MNEIISSDIEPINTQQDIFSIVREKPACENHAVNAATIHRENRVLATMPRSELPSRYIRFMH